MREGEEESLVVTGKSMVRKTMAYKNDFGSVSLTGWILHLLR